MSIPKENTSALRPVARDRNFSGGAQFSRKGSNRRLTIRLHSDHLRSNVATRSCHATSTVLIYTLLLAGFQFLGKAEIEDLEISTDVEPYVLRT